MTRSAVSVALAHVSAPLMAIVDTRRLYEHVWGIYLSIGLGVCAFVCLVVLFASARYRRRSDRAPSRRHESNRLEVAYAVLLAGVAAFLLYVTFSAEHQIDTVSLTEHPALTVDVVASKWEWTFSYPGHDITDYSGTVGYEPLVVPSGEAVRFNLTTRDVIHGFWIPEVRFKRDILPGRTQVVVLDFDQRGIFQGHCVEYCGLRHADMVFPVDVVSPARFAAWEASGGRTAT